MLIPLSTTPHWWETEDYGCVREVIVERSKAVDLDVLQAAINVSGRDKFLRDGASRRVAMKRLYRRNPVDTLCQEGLGGRNGVVGATFILIIILYRICSKQSRVHAARIKTCNRAAVVRAVKADKATKHGPVCPIRHKADRRLMEGSCSAKAMTTANPAVCKDQEMRVDQTCSQAAVVHAVKADKTTADSVASQGGATSPLYQIAHGSRIVVTSGLVEVKGHAYLLVVIRQLLLMSGDVELNPGPLDRGE